MIVLSILFLFLAIVSGTVAVLSLIRLPLTFGNKILTVSLGIGVGLGSSAVLFYLLLLLGASPQIATILSEVLLIAAATVLFFQRKPLPAVIVTDETKPPAEGLSGEDLARLKLAKKVLLAWVWLGILLSVVLFFSFSWQKPHGDFDALAIWNVRARFLALTGDYWRESFSPDLRFTHVDYPILVPSVVAQSWIAGGNDTSVVIPILVAFCFLIGTIGVVGPGLARLKSPMTGLLACLLLVGNPTFTGIAALQYADTPLAYFIASSLICAGFSLRLAGDPQAKPFLLLTGFLAGMAAWTKNEGQLFLFAMAASFCLVQLKFSGVKNGAKSVLMFALGALPLLLVLLLFKTQVEANVEFLANESSHEVLRKIMDPNRWLVVLQGFAQRVNPSDWVLYVPPFLLLYLLLARVQIKPHYRSFLLLSCGVTAMLSAAYIFIFVITPIDLNFYFTSTVPRLIIHALMPFVVAYCLLARVPDVTKDY